MSRVVVRRSRVSDLVSGVERADFVASVREHILSGLSVSEVSLVLGVEESEVREVVRGLLESSDFMGEFIEERLRLHLLRLDGLWRALWSRASAGEISAVLGCLRVLERESRLLGLDAAEKRIVRHEVSPLQEYARLVFASGELGSGGDIVDAELVGGSCEGEVVGDEVGFLD
ncbi:MAG: hypothetical protein KatS3mg087_1739 [Patescibacteria group bacterium]|nr:MAG: hypothetical protein KatS3mg087_1739 [Patescibacteria group bacterium]